MKTYSYKTVKAIEFFASQMVTGDKDAYISPDANTDAIDDLLAAGYRFVTVHVQTNLALFEKEITHA